MKHILLPTDFSDTSYEAITYAVQLFINEECTFYVLNTYTPVALYTTTIYDHQSSLNVDIGELYKNSSKSNLTQIIEKVTDAYPNKLHTFEAISSYNILSQEIAHLVESRHIDCIIMGTKGASGLKEVFIGSQTMQVIKSATVPVIGVPSGYKYTQLKDILFATDYRSGVTQPGLKLLEEICRTHISRLIFLNAYYGVELDTEQLSNKTALDTYFERDAHINEMANGMDVLEAIDDFQSRHKVDLLALVHNKHNFFENLLFTPVVSKIVHHTTTPFMILPPPEITVMIRVLIPTDFSVNSLNALTYAHMLFQEEPVTFTLLHAYEPTALQILGHQTPVRLASLYHSLKVQAIEELESLKEEILIKNEIAHHNYEVVAYGGHLNDAIKSMSDQKIDYIVMGSKGATGLKEMFIGTITHSVISHRHNIPLLVVPEKVTFVIPKSIGFATDFEKPYHKEEFEPLLLLTRLWQATIRMVEVYEEHNLNQNQKEHIQDLESLLQEMKYRFHVIPKFSTLENCIHIFDEELQIDLLVMIDYPKSFFEKLMREPVIKKMSFHISLPFLVLPSHS